MKCAMCGEKLDDIVYGLVDSDEYWFCCRFCRDMFKSDMKFAEHQEWEKGQ
jgi:hypothetical protein